MMCGKCARQYFWLKRQDQDMVKAYLGHLFETTKFARVHGHWKGCFLRMTEDRDILYWGFIKSLEDTRN